MKKLIAILMVMAIVAGFAFAETHTMKVDTVVGEVIPSFQLQYRTGSTVKTNAAASNNTLGDPLADPAVAPLYNGQFGSQISDLTYAETIHSGKDISKEDITAKFYAVLAVGAKQKNKTYTLKFTANPFEAKADGEDHDVPCTSSVLASVIPTSAAKIVAIDGEATATGANVKSQDIKLLGAPATSAIDLLSFEATWTKDPTVDMGTWTATVTLDITAN